MTAPALADLSPEEKRRMLARLLAERTAASGGSGPRHRSLSFAQHRLWFVDQLDPGSAAFNISTAVRLRGALEPAALRRALAAVTARHETLRTAIRTIDGKGFQEVHPDVRTPLVRVDLRTLAPERRLDAARSLVARDARRPFVLSRRPLWRMTLAALAPDDHVLVLTMHHIVSDGLSMEVFHRELVELYRAERAGRPSPLPARTLQYADFADWQRRELEGEGRLAEQLAYWRRQLAGVDTLLELPSAAPRERVRSERGRRRARRLAEERLAGLRELARSEGTTLFVLVLAAFQSVLGGLTGRRDLVVGAPFAGRNSTELEGMIGFLLNLVPLRADLSGDPTLRELVARTRRTVLEAQENQDLPFDAVVDALGLPRSQDTAPLVQMTCDVQTAPPPVAARADGLEVGPLGGGDGGERAELAQFDLSLNAMVAGDRMRIHVTCRADLYDDDAVARLLDRLEATLAALAERPDLPLAALERELADGEAARDRRREQAALSARREKFDRLRRRAATERSER